MNFKRDLPEEVNPSPEFIKVSYDKYGNPIDVKPVKGTIDAHNGHEISEKKEPVQRVNIQTLAYDTKVIGNWLNVLNQNMYSIREQIKNVDGYEKMIPFIEKISQNIAIFERNFDNISKEFDAIRKALQDVKVTDNSFLEQFNLFRENLRMIQEEMNDSRHVSNLLMNDIVILKEEVKNIKFDPSEILESINLINNNFAILRNHFVEMNQEVAGMINQMNAKLSDLSWKMENIATKEDLDMVISGFISKQELYQTKNELEEEIKGNHINRDELVSEIVAQTTANMQKLLQRKKRKIRVKIRKIKIKKKRNIAKKRKFKKKIVKGKIRKINKNVLTKKLLKADITTYPSALIVTERKMQKIGRAVFDVAKTLNKNVLMIMQDKMKESDGFEPITYDAMLNSDAIFVVAKKNMRENPSLQSIKTTKKIFIVNNKMKFTEMN
jgi:hypothetical protein